MPSREFEEELAARELKELMGRVFAVMLPNSTVPLHQAVSGGTHVHHHVLSAAETRKFATDATLRALRALSQQVSTYFDRVNRVNRVNRCSSTPPIAGEGLALHRLHVPP